MNNFTSLITFNHAFMSYRDFLFSRPNNLRNEPSNIRIIEVLFSCLNIILNQDRINTYDENLSNYIDKNILEQIITIISSKQDNKYYIGDMAFNNPEEIIKLVRNKIAHGEFFLDKQFENIIFPINQEYISIPIKGFYSIVILLVERLELYTISPSYNRTQLFASTLYSDRITKPEEIDDLLDNIYYIDYTFYGNPSLTPKDKAQIEELLKEIPPILSKYEETTNTKFSESTITSLFSKNGLIVKPIIKSLKQTPHTASIKKFILSNFNQINEMDLKTQIVLISNWYQKLLNDNHSLENITNGIHYNLITLNSIKDTNAQTSQEAFEKIESNSLFSSIVEIILSTELLGFYIHFQYPLENICKSKDNTNKNQDYFDYSRLNLSMLKPTIFLLPEGKKSSLEAAVLASNRRLELIDNELDTIDEQISNLNKMISNSQNSSDKTRYEKSLIAVINKRSQILTRHQNETDNLISKEQQLTEFSIKDKNTYYHNRYLIEYIRNAISHGNVHFYYSETNANLENCIIRFINKKDGVVTLDLSVTIQDFEKIFGEYNLNILDEYLKNQRKDRKL